MPFSDSCTPNWGIKLRRGLVLKNTEKIILPFPLQKNTFCWENKNLASKNAKEWRDCTQDHVSYMFHYVANSENMVLFICSGTYNLQHPKTNKDTSLVSRLHASISVRQTRHTYSLCADQKDWFRTSPFHDGIIFSWKLAPCHLSLSENRPCTIKWSVTTCH